MRIWLDAEHGYLPAKAEWYLKTESSHGMNATALTRAMQVDKFGQTFVHEPFRRRRESDVKPYLCRTTFPFRPYGGTTAGPASS